MIDKLKEVAAKIKSAENILKRNAEEVRKENKIVEGSLEEQLYTKVNKEKLNLSVVAVDGGILADRMHGCDIVIGRAAAANFVYSDSKLVSCEHFPMKFPESEVEIRTGLDEHEAMVFRQLFRLKLEITTAAECVERFSPEYLLLDGSVVPLGSDRPSTESRLSKEYNELIDAYKKLFSICDEKNCQLVGVVKDSRGKRMIDLLGLKELEVSDTLFANFLLKENERSATMSYASEKKKTPVLKDLEEYGKRIQLFYIKVSENDLPLRIEILQGKFAVEKIASVIHSLSSISKTFTYPAVLIEADLCAAMNPVEMENLKKSLFALSDGAAKPLRRNNRPFR